jgi:hypothetical protein
MAARLRARLLQAMRTDSLATRDDEGTWVAPCLHCQSRLSVAPDGTPLGAATLEHIVPRSWFGRAAARALTQRVGDPDAIRNIAVACARCNQHKGRTHDAHGPASERARAVVDQLLDRRAQRYRAPPQDTRQQGAFDD